MTIFFIWETLLIFGLYAILKKHIKKGLVFEDDVNEKGIRFLLKSKNPIIKFFRYSLVVSTIVCPFHEKVFNNLTSVSLISVQI